MFTLFSAATPVRPNRPAHRPGIHRAGAASAPRAGQYWRCALLLVDEAILLHAGLSVEQMQRLRGEFGVYGVDSGRICVAALNSKNIDAVVGRDRPDPSIPAVPPKRRVTDVTRRASGLRSPLIRIALLAGARRCLYRRRASSGVPGKLKVRARISSMNLSGPCWPVLRNSRPQAAATAASFARTPAPRPRRPDAPACNRTRSSPRR